MAISITDNIIAITNLISQMKTRGVDEDKRLSKIYPF